MGKNVHVEFGRTEEEVLVFSGYASKATVWCLKTGRAVEIRDPKFEGKGGRGWGYRPASEEQGRNQNGSGNGARGVLAILCRAAGQDLLLLLAPRTYAVIRRVELPTIDAQGLKWSRDGRWLAVWDSAASGYRLCIYTADGHLYRTISREPSEDINEWAVEGLGVKSVEWVPGGEWLAVGGWDRRVRILSTRTFSPTVFLDHTAQIHVPSAPVYTEQVDSLGVRTYVLTPQPATPPKAQAEKNEGTLMKQGISILTLNNDGTMCATRDDSTPTTVWIWDLRSLKPRSIVIQHAPVRSLTWHPTNPLLLLIQSMQDSPTIYLYTTQTLSNSSLSSRHGSETGTAKPPAILDLAPKIKKPAGSLPPKWDAKWLPTPADKKPALAFGHAQGYILLWPEGKDTILRFENPDAEGEESDDSLYDILTGRTPVPRLRDSRGGSESENEEERGFQGVDVDGSEMEMVEGETHMHVDSSGSFEDTFRERRNKVTRGTSRGTSVFDESGMDEMF